MDKYKLSFITILSTISGLLGTLVIPFGLLLVSNMIDYLTGVIASPYRNQKIDSYKGIQGIKKKICMWFLVLIGGMVDILLIYATEFTTIDLPLKFMVAGVTAIWLFCNESLSTLENLKDIGVKLPPFLNPLLENIKTQTENKIDTKEKVNKESEEK